jgi:hypothetical protein
MVRQQHHHTAAGGLSRRASGDLPYTTQWLLRWSCTRPLSAPVNDVKRSVGTKHFSCVSKLPAVAPAAAAAACTIGAKQLASAARLAEPDHPGLGPGRGGRWCGVAREVGEAVAQQLCLGALVEAVQAALLEGGELVGCGGSSGAAQGMSAVASEPCVLACDMPVVAAALAAGLPPLVQQRTQVLRATPQQRWQSVASAGSIGRGHQPVSLPSLCCSGGGRQQRAALHFALLPALLTCSVAGGGLALLHWEGVASLEACLAHIVALCLDTSAAAGLGRRGGLTLLACHHRGRLAGGRGCHGGGRAPVGLCSRQGTQVLPCISVGSSCSCRGCWLV